MDRRIGVYIHIPFCASKCAYCDFYSLAGCDELIPAYQTAILNHVAEHSAMLDGCLIDTVYFGGGTPGFYGANRLVEILDALRMHSRVLPDAEITAEVNPGTITRDGLHTLRRGGFNRLSIGVQSADDRLLGAIGRIHTFGDAAETVANAREEGFDNVSVDLIYGLPSQEIVAWAQTIARVDALNVEHISCYGLKLEEGTPLFKAKDALSLPDDDAQSDMYLYAILTLDKLGYAQYEISNFAKPGFESRHNLKYWLGEEYMGIGAGAHSYIDRCRYSFIEDIDRYIDSVRSGKVAAEHKGELTESESAAEYLMLRLRTTRGISEEEYYNIRKRNMEPAIALLRKYESNGWTQHVNGRWRFTPEGFMLSNTLIAELLDAQNL